ncbi:uncharacterized protein BDZ99DRAFT_576064 [Mytilinidion resinicola]|uniref:Uncharacterized protein n=1 Tax=Mytilinidion resinicola TaxID=574789 RepID=A0A6A6Y6E4_9PEZI|nr:uncharacterized protein BDZ99DRAFT_576064 [Mytilinidion resinicola]KAF2803584.1 hypothetical protein BDZ99DRAFT_576064 [Mytilinidion resinicola]
MTRPMFPETKIRLAPLVKKVVPLVNKNSAAGVILKVLSRELEDCHEHVEKKGKARPSGKTKGKERENSNANNERPQLENWVNEQARRRGCEEHGEEDAESQDGSNGGRETESGPSRHHHRKYRKSRPHALYTNESDEREHEQRSRRPGSTAGRRYRLHDKEKHRHFEHAPCGEVEDNDQSPHDDSRFMMSGGAGPSFDQDPGIMPPSSSNGNLSLDAFDELNINDARDDRGLARDPPPRPDFTDSLVRPRQHPQEGRGRRRRRRKPSPSPPRLGKWWQWGKYGAECVRYEAERIKREEERKKRRQRRRAEARKARESSTGRNKRGAGDGNPEEHERVYPKSDREDDDGGKIEGHVDPQFRTAGYRAGGSQTRQRQTSRDRPSIDLSPHNPISTSHEAKQFSRPATSMSSYSRAATPVPDRPSTAPTPQGPVLMPNPASFLPPLSKLPYPSSRAATRSARMPSPFRIPSPILTKAPSAGPTPELSMPSTPRPTEAMLANRTMLPSSFIFPTPPENRDHSASRMPSTGENARSQSRSHRAESDVDTDGESDSGSWGGGGARADVRREMSERFADMGKGVVKGIGIGKGLWSGGEWGWDKLGKNESKEES